MAEAKRLSDRVLEYISRHRMFAPGQKVAVAVSGGADSVCLLRVLFELAPRWALELGVAHLNHKLRGAESDGDAQFVRELAARLGLPLHYREADVAAAGDNLEQAGRNARREFFLELRTTGAADRIALGHTRDDQAETVLFRFLRGSGTAGLAGVLPVTDEGFVRPMLTVRRADVEQYLRERGIAWREDSSNLDRGFARNRIRHDLLPALSRDWNPSLSGTLAATAEIARDEEEYWAGVVGPLAGRLFQRKAGSLTLPTGELNSLPLALRRRLVRRALEDVRGDLRAVEFGHVEAILELARSPDGSGRVQAPGVDVFRSFDWLRLAAPAAAEPRNWALEAPVPGKVAIPPGNRMILLDLINSSERMENPVYNDKDASDLDWVLVSGRLQVRNWRPGDEYRPAGRPGIQKVKTLFQEARVPLWERREWPIITRGEEIVWVKLFGAACGYLASSRTRTVLRIREAAPEKR